MNQLLQEGDSIATYDSTIQRAGWSNELVDRITVAKALLSKGSQLGKQGKPAEALVAYDLLLSRFAEAEELPLRELVAKALFNKGVTLSQQQKLEEAIAAYDLLTKLFSQNEQPSLREAVAKALFNKGVTLDLQQKPEEEIAAYDLLLDRFGEAQEPALRQRVAEALFNKGVTLGKQQKPAEELAAYDLLLSKFGDAQESALRETVIEALLNKALTLGKQQKPSEELATYDLLLTKFAEAPESSLRQGVAKALCNKAMALKEQRRLGEQIAACDLLLAKFGDAQEPPLRQRVAEALLSKGLSLGQQQKPEEEIATYDLLLQKFEEAPEPLLREQVARAMLNKAAVLGTQEKEEAALAAYDLLLERFADSPDSPLREMVVRALLAKSVILVRRGYFDEALRAAEEAIALYPESTSPYDWEAKALAYATKGYVLAGSDRFQEAHQAFVEALKLAPHSREVVALRRHAFCCSLTQERVDEFLRQGRNRQSQAADFFSAQSRFRPESSLLLSLRQWNPHTPVADAAPDDGGGYFILHGGCGIVIDPGRDFIEQFQRASGRVTDMTHVILSHAGNDRAADLEALFALIHEYNRRREAEKRPEAKKKLRLYLSQDAYRKCAPLLAIWRDAIAELVALNPGGREHPQVQQLAPTLSLTVLKAYHDDLALQEDAVGLALDFSFGEMQRRIVFTCDSGLFPSAVAPRQEEETLALWQQYPQEIQQSPDLLVLHIGSVAAAELVEIDKQLIRKEDLPQPFDVLAARRPSSGETGGADHAGSNSLGLFGAFQMIEALSPKCVMVSGFGEEMRDIRIPLAIDLDNAFYAALPTQARGPRVFCADPVVVYRINDGAFLCHQTLQFESAVSLSVSSSNSANGIPRPYLIRGGRRVQPSDVQNWIEAYERAREEGRLPYCL